MAKTPNVALRVDQDLWAKFKVATRERGDTMTKVIEERIEDYIGESSTRDRSIGLRKREAAIYGIAPKEPALTVHVKQPTGSKVHAAIAMEEGDLLKLKCSRVKPTDGARIVDGPVDCPQCLSRR